MSEKPSTISDAEWRRLQKAAAEAAGGLVKNDTQKAKADTWSKARGKAGRN
jgi:hypothetical protein